MQCLWRCTVADLVSLFKLCEGLKIDLKGKSASLTLPFVTIENIPLAAAKELSKDEVRLARVLSDCVVTRRVLWEDLKRELASYALESLDQLAASLTKELADIDQSNRKSDKVLGLLLRQWANQTTLAIKDIRDAISFSEESKRTEYEREYMWEPEEDARKAVALYRTRAYPIAVAISGFLPKDNPIREEAEVKLSAGRDLAIQFGIASRDFESEGWSLESSE